MTSSTFNLQEYETYIEMSHEKHILVEGTNDENFFNIILDVLNHNVKLKMPYKINIDTAEDLRADNAYGNREKIEIVCQNILGTSYEENLLGFVDREFREFEILNTICDKLRKQRIEGRLVWTRGHSIENYYFDIYLLRDAFRAQSDIKYFEEIYNLFSILFPSALYLACALSLAAKELEMINSINHLLQYENLNIINSEINLDFQPWLHKLAKSPDRLNKAQKLIQNYLIWRDKTKTIDSECIKWLCHGHIGFKILWALYEHCTFHTYINRGVSEEETRKKIQLMRRRGDYSYRLSNCFYHNIKILIDHLDEYPLVVFKIFKVDLHQ